MVSLRRRGLQAVAALALLGAMGLLSPVPVRGESGPGLSLLPGEYLWLPELAPRGPMLVLVSLPEQRAYVYRNGVRIGVATVSTGKAGFETPTGVFTVLQKNRAHYSNLYDDAPMPFMQRLTWDGVAMHAGRIPGYPASHGCVRLPYDFAEKLFTVTARGMTVVIVDQPNRAPMLADPSLFPAPPPEAARPLSTPADALIAPAMPEPGTTWTPERAPPGALSVVVSTHDRAVVVVREGIQIGRGPLQVRGDAPVGTHAYVLLDGTAAGAPSLLPDRPRRRWLRVHGDGGADDDPGRYADVLSVPPGLASAVYDALTPGAMLLITDEPLTPETAITVLESQPPGVQVDPRSGRP